MDLLCSLQSSSSEDEAECLESPSESGDGIVAKKRSMKAADLSCDPTLSKKTRVSDSVVVPIIRASQAPGDLFVRAAPHRRGHWSGHILIPIKWSISNPLVLKSIQMFQSCVQRLGHSGVIVQHEGLHISLSRPFSLQLGQIDSFVNQLSKRLDHVVSTVLYVNNRNGGVLVNEEKTRSFWGWRVQPNEMLRRMLGHIDAVLENYNQPTYYYPPIFHISLASIAGNVHGVEKHISSSSSDDSSDGDDDEDENNEEETEIVRVNEIHCKFGTTKNYVIQLKQED